jgi:hypothetical protein
MDPQIELKLIIRLDQTQSSGRFHDQRVGGLLQELAVPLRYWRDQNGRPLPAYNETLRVQFERTHEWELVVGLALVGVGLLSKSFCDEFGKQLAQKLINHLFPDGEAAVKSEDGPNSPTLLDGKESRDSDKVAEALGASQMANVQRIEIIRIIVVREPNRYP